MSDHNPSDSFDNHPENAGCSNDDFEQIEAPGNGYFHDHGDADGPDPNFGSDVYGFNYDDDQGAQVSTTTGLAGEDEAESDRYAAGASEAEAYEYNQQSLINFGDDDGQTLPVLEPSAPLQDLEPANSYASSKAADILSTIAPSASPPSGHYQDYEEPISSSNYDDDYVYDYNAVDREEEEGQNQQVDDDEDTFSPEQFIAEATSAYVQPTAPAPEPTKYAEPTLCSSSTDVQTDKKRSPSVKQETEKKAVSFVNLDPREDTNETADVAIQLQFIKDLIYWRDIKKSGSVFGALLVVLISLAIFSVITVLAYASLVVLTGTFGFVIYKKVVNAVSKTSDSHPFSCLLNKDITLHEENLKCVIKATLNKINAVVNELRHLFLIEDTVDSIKFGLLLWALTYIGSWFSDIVLIILVIVVVFTVPKLYETYQVQIDSYIAVAKKQIGTYLCIIRNKLPFLKKKEKSQ